MEAKIMEVKRAQEHKLLQKKNVVGVGIGKKIVEGKQTDQDCITVMVNQKVSPQALSKEDVIPSEIEGILTDVVQVGTLRAFAERTDRWRPAPGGVSIGHYKITAGTLGTIVKDKRTGKRLILSNNHVLANSNDATQGEEILQPGPYDGGKNPQDRIATLDRFIPIKFGIAPPDRSAAKFFATFYNLLAKFLGSFHRLRAIKTSAETNRVDAALALPLANDLVTKAILEIGEVTEWIEDFQIGMVVKKSGRTTKLTEGTVQVLDATVTIQYGEGKIATFTNQIVAGPMSQPGDSGSLIVDSQNRAAGLLFAGSEESTIFNPIKDVISLLDIDF
ncbi:MAG: hypothetical protein ABSB32_07395 [Thermodesulfobacteriota bacterium]|jgi:hypothetical protein